VGRSFRLSRLARCDTVEKIHVLAKHGVLVRELVAATSDITLDGLSEQLAGAGIVVGPSAGRLTSVVCVTGYFAENSHRSSFNSASKSSENLSRRGEIQSRI
jgi:hypothetical protein